jgi:hypothetical protein
MATPGRIARPRARRNISARHSRVVVCWGAHNGPNGGYLSAEDDGRRRAETPWRRLRSTRRRKGAGVPPGLQNRCAGRSPVGGFDSRPPPLSLRRPAMPGAISPRPPLSAARGRVRFPSASASCAHQHFRANRGYGTLVRFGSAGSNSAVILSISCQSLARCERALCDSYRLSSSSPTPIAEGALVAAGSGLEQAAWGSQRHSAQGSPCRAPLS